MRLRTHLVVQQVVSPGAGEQPPSSASLTGGAEISGAGSGVGSGVDPTGGAGAGSGVGPTGAGDTTGSGAAGAMYGVAGG